MNNKFGAAPVVVENIPLDVSEMMFYMYLPIKLKKSPMAYVDVYALNNIPTRLDCFLPLIHKAHEDFVRNYGSSDDKYIYITAKHVYVTPDNPGNRPGWHCDGFGTDDINYIWTDKHPTIFNVCDINLSKDCDESMEQMNKFCLEENNVIYKKNDLIRLDQYNIHKCPEITKGCMRTFVKISYSDHKYNLKGNSHNYLLDYDWKMYDREEVRNHPTTKESDYIK